jgi:hypothetical protein
MARRKLKKPDKSAGMEGPFGKSGTGRQNIDLSRLLHANRHLLRSKTLRED